MKKLSLAVLFIISVLSSSITSNAQSNRLIYLRDEPVYHAQVGGITTVDINWGCNGAVFAIESASGFEVQVVNKQSFDIEPVAKGLWVLRRPQDGGFNLQLIIHGDLTAPGPMFFLHTYGVFWGDRDGNLSFDTSVARVQDYNPGFISIDYGIDEWELYARNLRAFSFSIQYDTEDDPPVIDISNGEIHLIDISPRNHRTGNKVYNQNHIIGYTDGQAYTGPLIRYTVPSGYGYTMGNAYFPEEFESFYRSFKEYLPE